MGTKDTIKIKLGLLIIYPTGVPDTFEYIVLQEGKSVEWETIEITGNWFQHALLAACGK